MGEPWEQLLGAYARLVVRVGANVQLGQRVVIRSLVEHADVARAVAAEAYRVGASHVSIQYDDPHVQRAAVEHAPDEVLGRSLAHELESVRSWQTDGVALIALTGNPSPALMEGLDPTRLARSQPIERIRETLGILSGNEVAWTVAGAPNPGWAQSIFGTPDLERLWQAVAVAMRLDEADPVRSWQEHLAVLAVRRDLLNERGFDRIRFRGPGTHLTVGLSTKSVWVSGALTTTDGTPFVPNMPTEEVFTSPDWRRADGTVRTTAPFYLAAMNALVDGLELELADGAIRHAHAHRGEAAVHAQLDNVPRARHLGEVALVDGQSRVRRTGLVFNDMLYDENAGCHVAWGAGFPIAFDGTLPLDPQARVDAGLNQAATHVDIVVGSPSVDVDGLDASGTATPIIRGDEFSLN